MITDKLRQLITAFYKLSDRVTIENVPPEMLDSEVYPGRLWAWKPIEYHTDSQQVEAFLHQVQMKLPALYIEMISEFRWLEIDLELFCLLANRPGPLTSGILYEVTKDSIMFGALAQHGLFQFGKAVDSYDPICFDTTGIRDGDCRVVRLPHEPILCEHPPRLSITVVADSFGQAVDDILQIASLR